MTIKSKVSQMILITKGCWIYINLFNASFLNMWDFNKNPRNTYLKKELYYKYKMLRICLKTIKTFYIVKMQNAYST